MLDNAPVIPSRADIANPARTEGPRNRSKIDRKNAFAMLEALASSRRFLDCVIFKANVRSFAVLRGSG